MCHIEFHAPEKSFPASHNARPSHFFFPVLSAKGICSERGQKITTECLNVVPGGETGLQKCVFGLASNKTILHYSCAFSRHLLNRLLHAGETAMCTRIWKCFPATTKSRNNSKAYKLWKEQQTRKPPKQRLGPFFSIWSIESEGWRCFCFSAVYVVEAWDIMVRCGIFAYSKIVFVPLVIHHNFYTLSH